ncbi:MAG: hypothetical protein LWY06_10695, partial [Firmicutes bacterium]|nr:hypothetical protein [Bacillota bacterium]
LRLISKRESLELSFKKKKDDNKETLPFSKFAVCSNKQINIDREKLVNVIREKSKKYNLDTNQLLEKSRKLLEKNYDLWQLCCGHDMVNLLSLAIKKSGADQAANSENIEKYLRTVFQESHFQKTSLYQSLKTWENENKTAVLSF